jgi:CHASE2 domain-containing sensor protein
MSAEHIPLMVGCALGLTGVVLAVRASTWHERLAYLALGAINVLFLGAAVLLWPCGENDCGPVVPIYESAFVLALVAFAVAVVAGRRARRRPPG